MKKRSKRYKEASALVSGRGELDLKEAVRALKSLPSAKFDESVELAFKLGIDAKKSEQSIRGSFPLPHGLGKERKVIVFAEGDKAAEAKKAGADEVGSKDLADKIQGGWLDFDVAIAEPAMMKHVGKLGKILGPHGKMPSPKSGTVTENIGAIVKEFKAGKVEFRNDAGGNVQVVVGKKSFDEEKLFENANGFMEYLSTQKPSAAKGVFIKSVVISSTMSPGIPIRVVRS